MAFVDNAPHGRSFVWLPLRPGPPYRRDVPIDFTARMRRQKATVPQHWAVYSRAELLASGWSPRRIARALRAGLLVRLRKNSYIEPHADDASLTACALGGQVACVSEVARWGVFVLDGASSLHIRVPARSGAPRQCGDKVRLHWSHRARVDWASVDIIDALVDATRCQPVRAAIATLDSALHLRLIDHADLDEIFAALPRRLRVLRRLLDGRAESGAESLMRLVLRQLGCDFEVQVSIRGVGRVDFVVDGWLIIECDSQAHHSDWEQRKADLRRDQTAAAMGFVTYRAIAEDIFWHPERVRAAVQGLRGAKAGWTAR